MADSRSGEAATWLRPIIASCLGLILAAALVSLIGESPVHVLQVFYQGAFGSFYDLGLSLFYGLPLACAGLAVSMGLRTRLFNIGVEGQLTVAALCAAIAGLYGPADPGLNRCLGFFAALTGGFLWAAVLGYLRARRQTHEVVAGIMLNFVAYGLTSWLALNFFKNPANQNPETSEIPAAARISSWPIFDHAPLGWHAWLVPIAALLLWSFYRWTRLGFQMEAVGDNAEAAQHSGISVAGIQFWSLSLGGMLAGLVGFIEIYGNAGRFIVGFSPGYGFIGIAVALLGRLQPFGILVAAALFGALHKGSLDLDFETDRITRDFAMILQAVLILLMSCSFPIPAVIKNFWQHGRRSFRGPRN